LGFSETRIDRTCLTIRADRDVMKLAGMFILISAACPAGVAVAMYGLLWGGTDMSPGLLKLTPSRSSGPMSSSDGLAMRLASFLIAR